MCTLLWCNHSNGRNEAPNVRKFVLSALNGAALNAVVCSPLTACALFAPRQGLQFSSVLPHSFLFICTLLWCNHSTGRHVAPNLRKLVLAAVYGATLDGVDYSLVTVGALFAQRQGFHFKALLPHSFHFICTLLWCNHSTGLHVAPNLRKFVLSALYGAALDGVVCSLVTAGALFAPREGLHS